MKQGYVFSTQEIGHCEIWEKKEQMRRMVQKGTYEITLFNCYNNNRAPITARVYEVCDAISIVAI